MSGVCEFDGRKIWRAVDRYGHWFCSEACAAAWNRRFGDAASGTERAGDGGGQ